MVMRASGNALATAGIGFVTTAAQQSLPTLARNQPMPSRQVFAVVVTH
jgi:hypothetical protein